MAQTNRRSEGASADVLPTPARSGSRNDLSEVYFESISKISKPMTPAEERRVTSIIKADVLCIVENARRVLAATRCSLRLRKAQRYRSDCYCHGCALVKEFVGSPDQGETFLDDVRDRRRGKEGGEARKRAFDAIRATLSEDPKAAYLRHYSTSQDEEERSRAAMKAYATFERFMETNLRLVISVARKTHSHSSVELLDRVQEGNLSLPKAIFRFDPERGFRFSTYATWWLRHGVGRIVANTGRTIRLPVHVIDNQQKIRKAKTRLMTTHGFADPKAIAAETKLPVDKIEEIEEIETEPLSLDEVVHIGDAEMTRTRGDTIVDHAPSQVDTLIADETMERLRTAVNRLKPKYRDVLNRRFGLNLDARNPSRDEETLREIGEDRGLSRERVRQVEVLALKELRRLLAKSE